MISAKKIEKKYINKINSYDFSKLTNEELTLKREYFKDLLDKGASLDDLIAESFAVVKEACKRTANITLHDVQLIGGIALHLGTIAEMKTGEGKSITAVAPAYLNSLIGTIQIVTVNDYLAQRDAVELSPTYELLGMSCDYIIHDTSPAKRQDVYTKDVMYITNSELGFDYLKDNLVKSINAKVRKTPLLFCIIDEVDSILIDEARTPLIISSQTSETTELYKYANIFVKSLEKEDYEVDKKIKSVSLTESGIEKAETSFVIENFSDEKNILIRHHIEQALKANYDMKRDKDYIVKDNEVVIIDEHTGRMAEGRRYSNGLHQAIEAKEGVPIKGESVTQASITYQNFFKLYKKFSGMTGTGMTEKKEFKEIYKLDVIEVPTNKPCIRKDNDDLIFVNRKAKNAAIIKDIKECYSTGRPVLIGTLDIRKSEKLSKLLEEEGIPHKLLNAKQDKEEADIVSLAGQKGAVTIATNIAGRGTDIKLTNETRALGGLKIIATERAVDRRIDNQLIGRSGRQGDPGESQFYLSFEDELLVYVAENKLKQIQNLDENEMEPISGRFFNNIINNCQRKIENQHFESRKDTIKYDRIINNQRLNVYRQRDHILTNDCTNLIADMVRTVVSNELDKNNSEYLLSGFDVDLKNKEKAAIIEEVVKQYEDFLNMYENKEFIINNIILSVVDYHWMKYLAAIEELRKDIKLLSYRGEDPVRAYNEKATALYEKMNYIIKHDTVVSLFRTRESNYTIMQEDIKPSKENNSDIHQ